MLALTLALIGSSVCPVCLSPPLLLPGAPLQPALLAARSLGRRGRWLWYVPAAALAAAPTSLAERRGHPPTLAPRQRRRESCQRLRRGGSPHRHNVDLRLAAAKAAALDAARSKAATAISWPQLVVLLLLMEVPLELRSSDLDAPLVAERRGTIQRGMQPSKKRESENELPCSARLCD